MEKNQWWKVDPVYPNQVIEDKGDGFRLGVTRVAVAETEEDAAAIAALPRLLDTVEAAVWHLSGNDADQAYVQGMLQDALKEASNG